MQYFSEKRNGGKSGDGKRVQLAGAEAPAKGKRDEDESNQADRKQLLGFHVLEIVRRVEAKAVGRVQGQTVREGQGNSVQKTGSGATVELYVHKTEPSAARVDKLLPNWQHEGLAEERVWPMAATQGEGNDTQTMEGAENDLQELDEAAQLSEKRRTRG